MEAAVVDRPAIFATSASVTRFFDITTSLQALEGIGRRGGTPT
jgi:hypothetical protein